MESEEPIRAVKEPTLLTALVPLVFLILLIFSSLLIFGLDALDGPIQVALVLSCLCAELVALRLGYRWSDVQEVGRVAMGTITSAIFILFAVGALIGTWNLSGTIPTLVFYGIKVLSPSWYYLASAVICGVIAMSIGSSWTTAGTIGVGLVGIALMLGVSPAITAGAVISGAYLGDKLSPLSETTILTAQMVKVDLMTHIKAQIWTSLPAFIIACVVFLILGLSGPPPAPAVATTVELAKLDQIYWINPVNLLPLALLIFMSVRKLPAALSLMTASIFAALMAPLTQPRVVAQFVGAGAGLSPIEALKAGWQAMATGFEINSGIPDIDLLLSRGGMDSMLLTIWLIMGAVTFGTLIEELGLIARLTTPLISWATSTGKLYLAVFASGFGLNVFAGDQYIALVLPARIYRVEFAKRGLAPTNLSRLAADSGTVTSPLVPWNSCGAFMGAVLGVPTLLYLPFAIFCIASPVLSVVYGLTGFKIKRIEPVTAEVA